MIEDRFISFILTVLLWSVVFWVLFYRYKRKYTKVIREELQFVQNLIFDKENLMIQNDIKYWEGYQRALYRMLEKSRDI